MQGQSSTPEWLLVAVMVVCAIVGYAVVSFVIGKLKLPPPPDLKPTATDAAADPQAPTPEPEPTAEKGMIRDKKPRGL